MEAQVKDIKTHKVAWALSERNGKTYWSKVGVVFTNRDGSLNVKLDAIPVSGNLQIRDWEPRDDAPDAGRGRGGSNDDRNQRVRNPASGPLTELPF